MSPTRVLTQSGSVWIDLGEGESCQHDHRTQGLSRNGESLFSVSGSVRKGGWTALEICEHSGVLVGGLCSLTELDGRLQR